MKKRIFLVGGLMLLLAVTAAATWSVSAAPPAQDGGEAGNIAPTAPGPMSSTIVIFNPDTSGVATVLLEVYNAAGAVAYSTTVNVSPNGARLVNLPGSLGTNFQGGAQISSDKNVQALVVGQNTNRTARDAYEGNIAPSSDVTLPLVRHLAANTQHTLLAIQNTTGNAANVTVTFHNLDGSTAKTENLNIGAHRSTYLNTTALFPSGTFVGSAHVVSSQQVAVAAQSLYFKDTAAFGGVAAGEAASTLYLNAAARKVKFNGVVPMWSEIFVHNNGANATDVTLDFYSTTGALVTSTTATAVPVNGTAQFLLNEGAFDALGTNFRGWVKVRSGGEPLSATALQPMNKGKRLTSVNGVAEGALKTRYVCGDVSRSASNNSQISILNTDAASTAKVIVRLFNRDTGAKVGQTTVMVPAQSSTTVLLSDTKFAAAGNSYQGMALVLVKGASTAKLVVSVSEPFMNPKAKGTTGYSCAGI